MGRLLAVSPPSPPSVSSNHESTESTSRLRVRRAAARGQPGGRPADARDEWRGLQRREAKQSAFDDEKRKVTTTSARRGSRGPAGATTGAGWAARAGGARCGAAHGVAHAERGPLRAPHAARSPVWRRRSSVTLTDADVFQLLVRGGSRSTLRGYWPTGHPQRAGARVCGARKAWRSKTSLQRRRERASQFVLL